MLRLLLVGALLLGTAGPVHAQPCQDTDGDGYGVYPGTSTRASCSKDGIDCDDADAAIHPFAEEVCGNAIDDNCRHGADEGCGAAAENDGWRLMVVRTEGQFNRGELGGRAEQYLQGATRCIGDPNVLYLSHDCSTVWRSRDGGQTWEKPLSHGLYLPHGQSIEVDPVDCNRVLTIVDQAYNYRNDEYTGLYLSLDGGNHWQWVLPGPAMQSRRHEHNIAFAPSSADAQGALTWYAALYTEAGHADSALYRSDDRGHTWQQRASLAAHVPIHGVRVSPSDPETVFVASTSGLLMSIDGGSTLAPRGDLPAGAVTSLATSGQNASTIYAVYRGTTNGLARSTNGGSSFVPLSTTDSFHASVLDDARHVFLHPTDDQVFYVLPQNSNGGLTAIRTDDGGVSFTTVSIDLPADLAAWRWGVAINGNMSFVLMSASDSRNVVAQSRGAALYRTTEGVTFHDGSTLYAGANCGGQNYSIAFDPNDPERFIVAHQDIGLYLTENGANWFVARSTPFTWVSNNTVAWSSHFAAAMHPTEPDRFTSAVGTSFNRKLAHTTDAGQNWNIASADAGAYFRVVHHPYDPARVFAGNKRSLDGGATFAPLPVPAALNDSDLQVIDLCAAQPDVVYATSRSSRRIIRSIDKGDTWSLHAEVSWTLAPFDGYLSVAVDPLDCDAVYAVDGSGDLARYDGTSWQSLGVLEHVTAPDGYFAFVRSAMVDPNHPEVIYASIFGSGIESIFRSTDRGASWTDISLNRFRDGPSGINVSPHSGEVMVGSCSGTWVLPPPYPTQHGIYSDLVPRPSCLDGIENGDEAGLDCGGSCSTPCPAVADGDVPPGGDGDVQPVTDGGPTTDTGSAALTAGGCGCGAQSAGGGWALLALGLLTLLGMRRGQCWRPDDSR